MSVAVGVAGSCVVGMGVNVGEGSSLVEVGDGVTVAAGGLVGVESGVMDGIVSVGAVLVEVCWIGVQLTSKAKNIRNGN